jgi:fluoride exporter
MVKYYLYVALGGAIGCVSRFAVAQMAWAKAGGFAGTLTINVIGSLLLGVLLALQQKAGTNLTAWYCFLGIGFCGGFTTYSTFSVECVQLLLANKYSLFLTYILTSIIAGILAAFIGFQAAK